jgi:anti-anti-sigma regulatory factor
MRLEGALSAPTAEKLAQRIHDSLAHTKGRLVLDLNRLHRDKVESLQPLRDKLATYRSRIRLVLPQLSTADPELMLLDAMFRRYKS